MFKKKDTKKVALERINILFDQAIRKSKTELNLSDRYVSIARKISMKHKVRIPKKYKKLFCKNCYKFLLPGKTLRTRLKNKKLIYFCNSCKNITRYPVTKKS